MHKKAKMTRNGLYRQYFKRLLDFLVSLILILVLFLPGIIIAILIKVSAPREPIFFQQERVGKNGIDFQIYKFRTMSSQAPHALATEDFNHPMQYITPVGSFLRRTSIDELPQLLNVLKGEMSIIGPRPLIPTEKRVLNQRQQLGADKVLPGITGLAQISGRDEISGVKKAELDADYVKHLSAKLDAQILLKTIAVVLFQKGFHEGKR